MLTVTPHWSSDSAFTYNWQKKSGEDWQDIGTNSQSITISQVANGYEYYQCIVTGQTSGNQQTASFKVYGSDLTASAVGETSIETGYSEPTVLSVIANSSDVDTPILYRWYEDTLPFQLHSPDIDRFIGDTASITVQAKGLKYYYCYAIQGSVSKRVYFTVNGFDLYVDDEEIENPEDPYSAWVNLISSHPEENFTINSHIKAKNDNPIEYSWYYMKDRDDEIDERNITDEYLSTYATPIMGEEGSTCTYSLDYSGKFIFLCRANQEEEVLIKKYNVEIYRIDISNAAVTLSQTTFVSDGTAKCPAVTVMLDGKTLRAGIDYEVEYKNNVLPGKASVTVKGIRKYSYSVNKEFSITKATSAPENQISDDKKTDTTVSGKEFSETVNVNKPKNNKKKTVTVTWEKTNNADGYEVQYALNKKFTKSKKTKAVKSAKKTSLTIKKLKKGKTYYIRVRAYKMDGKKKVYGNWGAAKKVKIKK